MNMPYPNGQTEPAGYTYSEIAHYDSLDNLDGDPQANVTYVAYSDLYDGFPSQFTGAVCYGAGTKLRTIQGEIAIEDLRVGDLLWTSDAGYQPIVWIGKRTLSVAELAHKPHLRAIRMSAHALGHNQPERDLVLSPQHRLCLSSNIVERITGEHQALISAKDLLELDGVDVVATNAQITYHHVMTPEHQLVMAHGCLGETLFTGPQALRMIPAESRRELRALFPNWTWGQRSFAPICAADPWIMSSRAIRSTAAISSIKADQYRPWRGLRETLPQIRQSGLLQSPDAWFPSVLGNNAGYAMSATSN